jgi:hypothetical protein
MLLLLVLISHPSLAGWFSEDNYWQCLLDEMRNVQTDTIADEVIAYCKDLHSFHERVFIEKKSSWFGIKTARECSIKHGKNVNSELAARHIQAACYKLYPDK